ncbi:HAD-IA family hydrolase [Sinomonas sp. G460-2]|uniref:HAD-IA family hydrolase n=1 Tax=Sinomonas sp. G460-2 TaxID=3393464 RepID=UPI0039EFC9C0
MLGPLVVDLDGVLRIWDPAIIADAEMTNGLPAGRLARSAFGNSDRLHLAVTGVITDEQWREEIARELEAAHGAAGRAAVEAWSSPPGRTNGAVLAILRRERRRRRVALFSNATTRLDADLDRLGLFAEVDVVFNSSSLGLAKPSPEAFSAVVDALGTDPSECLFVDDTIANVLAAERSGLKAHHYIDPGSLDRFIASCARSST